MFSWVEFGLFNDRPYTNHAKDRYSRLCNVWCPIHSTNDMGIPVQRGTTLPNVQRIYATMVSLPHGSTKKPWLNWAVAGPQAYGRLSAPPRIWCAERPTKVLEHSWKLLQEPKSQFTWESLWGSAGWSAYWANDGRRFIPTEQKWSVWSIMLVTGSDRLRKKYVKICKNETVSEHHPVLL